MELNVVSIIILVAVVTLIAVGVIALDNRISGYGDQDEAWDSDE